MLPVAKFISVVVLLSGTPIQGQYCDIEISGKTGSNTAINDVYYFTGQSNGRPYYQNTDHDLYIFYYSYSASNGKWYLGKVRGSNDNLKGIAESTAHSPENEAWEFYDDGWHTFTEVHVGCRNLCSSYSDCGPNQYCSDNQECVGPCRDCTQAHAYGGNCPSSCPSFCDIEVAGKTGDNSVINGVYKFTDFDSDGKPHYHDSDGGYYIYYHPSQSAWYLSSSLGGSSYHAYVQDSADSPDQIHSDWVVVTESGTATFPEVSSDCVGGPVVYGECPATDDPISLIDQKCNFNDDCDYGEETCCEITHPSISCSCAGGYFMCAYTDACYHADCDVGPVVYGECPTTDDPVSLIDHKCNFNGDCDYGEETCCGITHPSISCSCAGGDFVCSYTDACYQPDCSNNGVDFCNSVIRVSGRTGDISEINGDYVFMRYGADHYPYYYNSYSDMYLYYIEGYKTWNIGRVLDSRNTVDAYVDDDVASVDQSSETWLVWEGGYYRYDDHVDAECLEPSNRNTDPKCPATVDEFEGLVPCHPALECSYGPEVCPCGDFVYLTSQYTCDGYNIGAQGKGCGVCGPSMLETAGIASVGVLTFGALLVFVFKFRKRKYDRVSTFTEI